MKTQPTDISRGHFHVRILKSCFRVSAGAALIFMGNSWLVLAGICFVIAEVLNIIDVIT